MPKFTNFPPLFKQIYEEEHRIKGHKLRYEIIEEFINENKFEKIAELGCGMGYPAIYFLANCPTIKEYIAIDPGPPKNNRGEKFESFAFLSFKKGHFIHKTAFEAAKDYPDYYFDLVYMDELCHITTHIDQYPNSPPITSERIQKNHKAIVADIVVWKKKVRKHGILCGRDYSTKSIHHQRLVRAVDEVLGSKIQLIPEKQNNVWWIRM